jgi:Protein of unknown function (DUF1353)
MFTTELLLQPDVRPDYWIVRAPLVWESAEFGRICVPPGFRTDLASIPRALRNLPAFDPNGASRRPAVVHDWLYAVQSHPKDFADRFLRTAMLAEGAAHADAEAFYEAVHLFGETAWHTDGAATLAAAFATQADYMAYVAGQS